MRKQFLVIFVAVMMGILMLSPNITNATPYYFSGQDEGGIGSATMGFQSGTTFIVTIDNTSPTDLIGATLGTGGNSPGITGFGFNIIPDTTYTSATLFAFDSDGNGTSNLFNEEWSLSTDSGTGTITLDYYPSIGTGGTGIDGALFNPAAFSDPNNTLPTGTNTNYFTTATLTLTFDTSVALDDSCEWSPFV